MFKQLYERGLVYRGFKVMPFSTACSTSLSNFEAGLNYKDVDDPAVMVSSAISKPATSDLPFLLLAGGACLQGMVSLTRCLLLVLQCSSKASLCVDFCFVVSTGVLSCRFTWYCRCWSCS